MSLPKPYYDDGRGIVIYCADCRTILAHLPKVDLVLTDPPYGISLPTDYRQRGRSRLAACNDFGDVTGDDKPFEPEFILQLEVPTVLFGANYYAHRLPISSGWLVWDKRCGRMQNDQADAELAWTNYVKGVRVLQHEWNGFRRDSEVGQHYHPTQKPIELMTWILNLRWTAKGTILDPFMGSGTTLVAAKQLGRKAIGIEIEEKYCQIAVERLRQEILIAT